MITGMRIVNSINFTFIVPPWPIQDRRLAHNVRLLGSVFQDGSVDTDLLASIAQVRIDNAARDRPVRLPFSTKYRRAAKQNRLDNKIIPHPLQQTPHKWRN